ncbi:hypothetical protein G6L15_08270 [Agrobacterium rhizogenes]|uniref:hypothetical protein n=1 Tax=Rhizobium rhizogenes TaxID=359 RepID=UPI001571FECE|nr:hypothetical protein [Rhizobium rhizogenes]NTG86140.1 hypothetical protein [Rhizobium rhizogenes]
MIIGDADFKYVERNVSRHGTVRYYFRSPDGLRSRLPDPMQKYPDFKAAHFDLCHRMSLPQAARKLRRKPTPQTQAPISDGRVHVRMFEKMVLNCRSRAAKKSVAFDINASWAHARFIFQNGKCAVSGIEMQTSGECNSPYLMSIDRIEPALGYIEENSRLVILAVNLAMNVWGERTFREIATAVASREGR